MASFELIKEAAPQARIGKLEINGKTIQTPAYFPTLTRSSDPRKVVETAEYLNHIGDEPLKNTGGFVVESHLAPKILDDLDESVQTTIDRDISFSDYESLIDTSGRIQIVEPNTDRLLYWSFRKDISPIEDRLPSEFRRVISSLDADEPEIPGITSPPDGYDYLMENLQRTNLIEPFFDLQQEYGSDLLISPYYPIRGRNVVEAVNENTALYRVARDIASRLYQQQVYPVIPLMKSVLTLESGDKGATSYPQQWLDIIHSYKELDADLIFIKATNVEMNPEELNQPEREGIVEFFKLLRNIVDVPVVFLGLDELSYILMAEGMDGYSLPLYKSPYRKVRIPSGDQPTSNGSSGPKFIQPRNWEWKSFGEMDSLGCNCPFCRGFNNIPPGEIEFSDQRDLRIKHWLWLKDEEIEEFIEAIEKDEVRPGVLDICKDSKWKKNFTSFL